MRKMGRMGRMGLMGLAVMLAGCASPKVSDPARPAPVGPLVYVIQDVNGRPVTNHVGPQTWEVTP